MLEAYLVGQHRFYHSVKHVAGHEHVGGGDRPGLLLPASYTESMVPRVRLSSRTDISAPPHMDEISGHVERELPSRDNARTCWKTHSASVDIAGGRGQRGGRVILDETARVKDLLATPLV
jgi:hypothetical protein